MNEILPVCWKRELRILMELAIPAVLVNLFSVAMGTVSQMLVGHISSDALAAAVCANLVFNVLWFFLFGFAGALDTLGAQSFGAGSMSGVNLWTKRAFILVSILSVPIMVPLFFSYGIMTTILAQPDDVAQVAQTYCRWLVFGLWPFAMSRSVRTRIGLCFFFDQLVYTFSMFLPICFFTFDSSS